MCHKNSEKFRNTVAYFIASTPSYEHRPHFERKALCIFLFRYMPWSLAHYLQTDKFLDKKIKRQIAK